ncbi:hypothetical protein AAG906_040737 [Vitis piasezkii]
MIEDIEGDQLEPEPYDALPEISFHAIAGTKHPQTIRVLGKLKNKNVTVLINGGSTHNFIDQAIVSKFGLPDFLPVATDYKQLTMSFNMAGTSHTFQGLGRTDIEALTDKEFNGLQGTELFFQIIPSNNNSQPTSYPLEMAHLLVKFPWVFETPTSLPPKQSHDHHIPLHPTIGPLHDAKFYSKLDLRSGYHQICLQEDDIPKTAFRTLKGHYEFLVMTFGFTNALATFQRVSVNPTKIQAVIEWPTPTIAKGVRGFLGLASYYRKFIHHFRCIAAPLNRLLRKDGFHWNEAVEMAFKQLKVALTSGIGLDAILTQQNRLVAYFSKTLKDSALTLSTYEKEMLAIVKAIKKWRPYLLGKPFTGLPSSNGYTAIMVVVNRLTKYAHFVALKHPFTVVNVAKAFVANVVRLHGEQPRKWLEWIPWAEFSYNTSTHSSTKMTPFEAVYDIPLPSLLAYIPGTSRVQAVDEYLCDRDAILLDQHRREVSFLVGDYVYLKLQPYRQTSVAFRASMKLAPRFFGPYKVIEKVGPMAYKLALPPGSQIHDVFHVSLLRKHLGPVSPTSTQLPLTSDISTIFPQPEVVLDRRVIHKGKYCPKSEILENEWRFTKSYPDFILVDKDP